MHLWLRLLRCLSSHHSMTSARTLTVKATRYLEKEARFMREEKKNGAVRGRKRCDLIPHSFWLSLEREWDGGCLTNALLANVSRPPTEQHPSVWLWCCLVVVMCAQLHEPTTLSPYSGEARAILPLLTASWWESVQAFMIMYAFFCCFTQPDASRRFFFHSHESLGGKQIFFARLPKMFCTDWKLGPQISSDVIWCKL